MNQSMLDAIIKQKKEEEITRQRGIVNNYKRYVDSFDQLYNASPWRDDDDYQYGKVFQVIKNRGETFHEFPLFIGINEYFSYLTSCSCQADGRP